MRAQPAGPVRPSVVIPTYQRADLLPRAVRCALDQELDPHEVIVVDDGSTDETAAAVRAIDGPVRYVWQENEGASAARNHGVRLAESEWVAFLDSDDIWRPGHLRRLGDAVVATEGRADLVFSDAAVVTEEGPQSWFEICDFSPASPFEETDSAFDWAMLPFQPMVLPASMVRRAAWLDAGGLRKDLPTREDTHVFLMLALTGRACAVAEIGLDVTAESAEGLRLTEVHPAGSEVYSRATITLYDDILRRPEVPTHHRAALRRRLANGYWDLGRIQMRGGNLGAGMANLGRAMAGDPASMAVRVRRTTQRGRA